MKIPFLIEVEAPAVALNSAAVLADLRQLIMDSVQTCLQRNPNYQISAEVKQPDGAALKMLTKADVAQRLNATDKTVYRWWKTGKIPEPVRIAAPHCTNGSPRWFPEDIPTARPLAVNWNAAA